jgi:membrane protein implicated in regulation of membrane protease activity
MKNKVKLSVVEWVFYPLAGVLVLGALALITLGLLASYLPLKAADNPLAVAQAGSPLSFMSWGLITLAVGVFIAVVVLLVFARRHDREAEKASRRAARLGKSVKSSDTIIDAEVVSE